MCYTTKWLQHTDDRLWVFPYPSVHCGNVVILLLLAVCRESVQVEIKCHRLLPASELLTLVVNVLVLVHFPVHVRVCVRVYVRVNFRVDLGS